MADHSSDSHGDVRIDHSHHAHAVSSKLLAGIYFALVVLTIVTVVLAKTVDFGDLSLLVAVAIASVKSTLVMAIFMHLRWDTPINNIAFLSSVIFLSLLFLFTLADIFSRGEANYIGGQPVGLPG
ncbi:MAG: cytochrome C oxidase subunit IV family protein [Planctomycetota bacterium]